MQSQIQNFKTNLSILKENLKRGLSHDQSLSIINNFENQFIKHNTYNEIEKQFINDMRSIVINHFTHIKIQCY